MRPTLTMYRCIEDAAKALAGNHTRLQLVWRDRPVDHENWAVVYTRGERSSALELRNAEQIETRLSRLVFDDDVLISDGGILLRVYDNIQGGITAAFRELWNIALDMDVYQMFDEADFPLREDEGKRRVDEG